MLDRRRILGLGAAVCLGPTWAAAMTHEVMALDGLALGGVDPLSFRLDGGPRPGDPAHRIVWRDVIWRFADAARLAAFERDPLAHAPAYGGYCAFALSHGMVTFSDPAVFTLVENRLFLYQSSRVRNLWLRDVSGHVVRADANWPQILG